MHEGVVITLQLERGFGFVRDDDSKTDYFFHCSSLPADLDFDEQLEQRRVTFDLIDSQQGRKRAINIRAAE